MFYILPPKGFSNLSTLEEDIDTRFNLLAKLNECGRCQDKITEYLKTSVTSTFDGLIEGSRRDCASHFIYRLACLSQGQIQDYWIKAEIWLCQYRLKRDEHYYLTRKIFKLSRDLKMLISMKLNTGNREVMVTNIFKVVKFLINNPKILECGNRGLCEHYFEVPWILVKTLVAERKVEVLNGVARIPCILIVDFLCSIFKELLLLGILQLKTLKVDIDDIRLTSIIERINYLFLNKGIRLRTLHSKALISNHWEVEKEVVNFPLCMQSLQSQLLTSLRLRHSERFRYSLFLKDLGLPFEQNIIYWKKFYSQPSKCSSGCSHVWEGIEAKRFEYSVRHMYGLEGKRACYSSYSCTALQAIPSQPQEFGGCPFRHLDEVNLRNLLRTSKFLWSAQTEEIVRATKEDNPSLACGYHLAASLHKHKSYKNKFKRISTYDPCLKYSKIGKENCVKLRKIKSFSAHSAREILKHDCSKRPTKNQSGSNKSDIKNEFLNPPCYVCNFNSISPELSFMSPIDFFKLKQNGLHSHKL